jgi:hypothetical protein
LSRAVAHETADDASPGEGRSYARALRQQHPHRDAGQRTREDHVEQRPRHLRHEQRAEHYTRQSRNCEPTRGDEVDTALQRIRVDPELPLASTTTSDIAGWCMRASRGRAAATRHVDVAAARTHQRRHGAGQQPEQRERANSAIDLLR